MSSRHLGLLAALAALWGGSYLLIKYALDGYSAAMIVSARCLIASVILAALGAAGPAHPGHPGAPEVGAHPRPDRGHGAVPADHVRRARRAQRADRRADLAGLAVRGAARAVHRRVGADRPPPGARHAAGPRRGRAGRRRRVDRHARGVPRRAGDGRRGVLLRALELRREGPLLASGGDADLVDRRDDGGPHRAPAGPRHHARPHARPRVHRRAGRARHRRHRARLHHLLQADQRGRRRPGRAGLLPRPGRGAVLRRHLRRRGDHAWPPSAGSC